MFVATYFYSNTGHSKAVTNSFRSKNLKEFQETYSVFAYVFGQVVLYGIKSAVFTICYGFSKWKPHVFVCLAFFPDTVYTRNSNQKRCVVPIVCFQSTVREIFQSRFLAVRETSIMQFGGYSETLWLVQYTHAFVFITGTDTRYIDLRC